MTTIRLSISQVSLLLFVVLATLETSPQAYAQTQLRPDEITGLPSEAVATTKDPRNGATGYVRAYRRMLVTNDGSSFAPVIVVDVVTGSNQCVTSIALPKAATEVSHPVITPSGKLFASVQRGSEWDLYAIQSTNFQINPCSGWDSVGWRLMEKLVASAPTTAVVPRIYDTSIKVLPVQQEKRCKYNNLWAIIPYSCFPDALYEYIAVLLSDGRTEYWVNNQTGAGTQGWIGPKNIPVQSNNPASEPAIAYQGTAGGNLHFFWLQHEEGTAHRNIDHAWFRVDLFGGGNLDCFTAANCTGRRETLTAPELVSTAPAVLGGIVINGVTQVLLVDATLVTYGRETHPAILYMFSGGAARFGSPHWVTVEISRSPPDGLPPPHYPEISTPAIPLLGYKSNFFHSNEVSAFVFDRYNWCPCTPPVIPVLGLGNLDFTTSPASWRWRPEPLAFRLRGSDWTP